MNRRDFIKLCAASSLVAHSELFASETAKEIYLTVDDGWYFTSQIVDLANHYKVPLNMFVIGQIVQENPKFWNKAVEQGHLLGSHTYYHPKFSRTDSTAIANDFAKYEQSMKNKIGTEGFKKITHFRYPYGNKGNQANKDEIKKRLGFSPDKADAVSMLFYLEQKFKLILHN
jgi:peptidoglycan/xylan/chitin deacetylase (PgdA/CDA1 family)